MNIVGGKERRIGVGAAYVGTGWEGMGCSESSCRVSRPFSISNYLVLQCVILTRHLDCAPTHYVDASLALFSLALQTTNAAALSFIFTGQLGLDIASSHHITSHGPTPISLYFILIQAMVLIMKLDWIEFDFIKLQYGQ